MDNRSNVSDQSKRRFDEMNEAKRSILIERVNIRENIFAVHERARRFREISSFVLDRTRRLFVISNHLIHEAEKTVFFPHGETRAQSDRERVRPADSRRRRRRKRIDARSAR